MKLYRYIYKTSQGVRQSGELSAASREEVFAALRAKGIRPIKVEAADGTKANGEAPRNYKRKVFVLSLIAALLTALLAVVIGGGGAHSAAKSGAGAKDAGVIARPLARQVISGDRARIAHPPADLFPTAAERYLAYFAEPGRPLPPAEVAPPAPEALQACLAEPLRIRADEFTEYVELKRIVTRIKEELRAYLAGGGAVADYLAELVRRQRLEISYREQAERKLEELLEGSKPNLPRAYEHWLKANARLRSMGIYPLSLPDSLRTYELTADLDD